MYISHIKLTSIYAKFFFGEGVCKISPCMPLDPHKDKVCMVARSSEPEVRDKYTAQLLMSHIFDFKELGRKTRLPVEKP